MNTTKKRVRIQKILNIKMHYILPKNKCNNAKIA